MAYRWFIGYSLTEPIPHFSTFGKNYVRRFASTNIFERIFKRILAQAEKTGYVDASAVFIDSTHIKASANKHKSKEVKVTKPIKQYQLELEEVIKKESTTDSECGLFVKGEHERCFAYSAQTACDKHGFVLAFELGAGNLHDGQMFHELYKKMDLSRTQIVALDAGYKTPGVVREIFKSGKIPAVPYTRPMTKNDFFKKSEYVYDEYFDCYLCPQNQILKLSKNKTSRAPCVKVQVAFLLPQFEKVGKEKAPKFYIFLLPSFLLTEIKAKSPSQIIPKRALSTV